MSEHDSTADPEQDYALPRWLLPLVSLAMIAALAWWFLLRGGTTDRPAPAPAAAHAAQPGTR
jgi:hypothetical protein